jgi:D-3-phosphoglycerate dehydrogenase
VKTLNKISAQGLDRLRAMGFTVDDDAAAPEGILVRSAKMHDMALPESVLAIARAGAGVNNIPLDQCAEAGIVVFNTPGANANAVKELVIGSLIMASRDVMGGSLWVREQVQSGVDVTTVVEKGKAAFVGPEITGKTLGVIGLGAIGVLVANVASAMGMEVVGYDPYLSVSVALRLDRSVRVVQTLDELAAASDYITIHVPYNDETKNTINADLIAKMKDGVRILNLARGELANDDDLLAALESGKVACYVTDFPNNKIALAKNVLPLPHLGASTPESEENCAMMAVDELADYLENGNIRNSVNMPACEMARSGAVRLCILHRNVPNMLAAFLAELASEGANVENMVNKSRGQYAYTMIDFATAVPEQALDSVRNMPDVLRLRVI